MGCFDGFEPCIRFPDELFNTKHCHCIAFAYLGFLTCYTPELHRFTHCTHISHKGLGHLIHLTRTPAPHQHHPTEKETSHHTTPHLTIGTAHPGTTSGNRHLTSGTTPGTSAVSMATHQVSATVSAGFLLHHSMQGFYCIQIILTKARNIHSNLCNLCNRRCCRCCRCCRRLCKEQE